MLQRIQTAYLTLVMIFTVIFVIMPLAGVNWGGDYFSIRLWGVSPSDANLHVQQSGFLGIAALIAAFAIMVLSVYTSLQYKNRLLQIKLGKLNIFLHVILVVSVFFYLDDFRAAAGEGFSYGVAVVFPLISMILILLANRAIKRDEDLVRSADRLR